VAHPVPYSIFIVAHSPGIKQLGHEVDHSPPSTDEVKNECTYSCNHPHPTPHLYLLSWHAQ